MHTESICNKYRCKFFCIYILRSVEFGRSWLRFVERIQEWMVQSLPSSTKYVIKWLIELMIAKSVYSSSICALDLKVNDLSRKEHFSNRQIIKMVSEKTLTLMAKTKIFSSDQRLATAIFSAQWKRNSLLFQIDLANGTPIVDIQVGTEWGQRVICFDWLETRSIDIDVECYM